MLNYNVILMYERCSRRFVALLVTTLGSGCDCAPSPACGNGVREGAEPCDGPDVGSASCVALGYSGGTIQCQDCTVDATGCSTCGDGRRTPGEPCDGADLGGATCASLGFPGGKLSCADCVLDAQACWSCGDGVRETGEDCDGSDFGSTDCASLGFQWGSLACTTDCALDDGACVPWEYNAGALRFDGIEGVDCGAASMGLPWGPFTVEAWVRPDWQAEGSLFEKMNWIEVGAPYFSSFDGSVLAVLLTSNNPFPAGVCGEGLPCVVFRWNTHQDPGDPSTTGWSTDGIPLEPETWHHVAFTWQSGPGLSEVALCPYVDGAPVLEGCAIESPYSLGTLEPSAEIVRIGLGIADTGSTFGLEGYIDEIRVWDRALSPAEILETMYSTLDGTEPGLVAYWPLDEGAGQFTTEVVTGSTCVLGNSPSPDSQDPLWVTETPF